jgi:two-component system, OmpR family, response regulator
MENPGILIVDDESAYHSIARTLFSAIGRPLHCVSDAHAAIEAVSRSPFALILMDIEMPDIDGYRATAMVRARGGWASDCPIIAFTSLQPEDGEDHFRRAGMNGHLRKPFSMSDVATITRRWIGTDEGLRWDGMPGADLVALMGEADAARMIDLFHDALRNAIRAVDAGEDAGGFGHRMGGLAGTLGFAMLSTAWLALQGGASDAWPTVRELTLEAITRHEGG